MKPLIKILIFSFLFSSIAYASAPNVPLGSKVFKASPKEESQSLTLEDCYRFALKQSEVIAINSELIKEAEAHFLQAFGTLMPQVSFSHTLTRQNSSTSTSLNRTYEQKFVFTQVLFSGFKEFAGIAGSHFEEKQREKEKLRAQQLLFVDVADAFYLLMESREDIKALRTVEKALLDRITELKSRVDIGKSRVSEVVSTETQLYNLQAEIESVKNQEVVARDLLEFLVGRPVDEIVESGINLTLKPETEYLVKAAARADVQAADFAWKVDQKKVAIARSGFFPTVNLENDYYLHRTNAPADSKWEAFLTVNVPIFEGTTTYGFVKEAIAKAKESELSFKRLSRTAVQDIQDAYANVLADMSMLDIFGKALKSAERSFDLQTHDYQLNVVNNLDVLAAIQSLEDARRNFIHVSNESKRFYWHLMAATGEINEKVPQ